MNVAATARSEHDAQLLAHVRGHASQYFPELGGIERLRVLARRESFYSRVIHVRLSDRTALTRDVVIKIANTVKQQFDALVRAWPGFAREPALRIPRPLECIGEGPALIMERVSGRPLLEYLPRVLWSGRRVQVAAGQCVKAGRWLRFYHEVEGRTPGRPLESERKWPLLLDAFSELARHGFDRGRLDHVTERLRAVAPDACAEARPVASLHGDFTVKNVLIEGDVTTGIDLWGAHENVVDHDIASFLNSLALLRLTRPAPARALDRLRDAFLEGYYGAPRSPGSATVLLQAIGLADGALEILKRRPTPVARVWVLKTVGAAIEGLVETRYRAEGSGAPVA